MHTYKVWVTVEEIDEDNDCYEDAGLPDSLGEFDTLEDARQLVSSLLTLCNPKAKDTSDHCKCEGCNCARRYNGTDG